MRPTTRRWAAAGAAIALVVTGCSEPEPEAVSDTTATTVAPTCDPDDLLSCTGGTTLEPFAPDEPQTADGEPIKLGMINQENTAAGSFPELSQAVNAAVEFVNGELGGIDGRPIEVEVCNTEFSPAGSTACAQQFVEAEVPAVLGGIDVFGNAIDVLEANGIPYIGGIPVSTQSMTSPISFQWSGGTWGAVVAFAHYAATELDAKSAAIVYGDFGPIADSAAYGESVFASHDVATQLVPFPITATDVSSPLQAAAATDPDALIVLAADTSCKPALEGVQSLGIEAQAFYVGACAAPEIISDVDPAATNGAIFNVESPLDGANPDFDLYRAVIAAYGDGLDPVGAGTVSFKAFMNLYMVLSELGGDGITSESIIAALEAKVDAPSFMGHDYTCDHEQFDGLPAACSPQQILGEMNDGTLTQLGDWIDVGAIYQG